MVDAPGFSSFPSGSDLFGYAMAQQAKGLESNGMKASVGQVAQAAAQFVQNNPGAVGGTLGGITGGAQ